MKPLIVSTGESLSCDPRDVVGHAVGGLAGLVELDQRAQRLGHRLGRVRNRRLEVRDDRADLRVVPAADAVDLLDELAVLLHQPRVERILLLEALEILHRHADVQVVGARREDVLARARRLVGDDRIDRADRRTSAAAASSSASSDSPALQRERRAALLAPRGRRGKRLRRALQHELARGQVVVGAGVEPEQLRVALDLGERRGIDARRDA